MPRNRRVVAREVKVGEIVDAAEDLFLADGYDATTMAGIAARAGVATNAVYWYFPSKDEVLAAVLGRRLDRTLQRLADGPAGGLAEQLTAALHDLDATRMVTATVHQRARVSPVVAELHQRFHDTFDRLLTAGLQIEGLPAVEAADAAAVIVAAIEGIHLHEPDRDPHRRDRLVLYLLDRVLDR